MQFSRLGLCPTYCLTFFLNSGHEVTVRLRELLREATPLYICLWAAPAGALNEAIFFVNMHAIQTVKGI